MEAFLGRNGFLTILSICSLLLHLAISLFEDALDVGPDIAAELLTFSLGKRGAHLVNLD